jgi:hypothetical protein
MTFHRESPSLSLAEGGRPAPAFALVDPRRRGAGATALPRSAHRLAMLALAAVALACDPYVQGNGVYREVERTPGPFAGVHVEDGIEATATVSDGAATTVRVSGDANVLDYVETEVQRVDVGGESVDVLHVSVDEPSGGYAPTIPIRAVILMPALRYLDAREFSRIEARDVAAPALVVGAAGGSEVEVKGPGGTTLRATLADANGDLGGWPVQDAVVMLTGRSMLDLSASGALSGEAHDTSTLNNLVPAATCALAVFDAATASCAPAAP